MKYSHNAYWCKHPVEQALYAGLEAIEFDIVYRLFGNKIFCSHSWKPLSCMYYGNLDLNLWRVAYKNEIKYVIIESKSFWVNQKKLYGLMDYYKNSGFQYVMSVQSRYPHQWIRGIWLKSFYKKYKEKLNILDKRTETELNEQVDLYDRKWWMF